MKSTDVFDATWADMAARGEGIGTLEAIGVVMETDYVAARAAWTELDQGSDMSGSLDGSRLVLACSSFLYGWFAARLHATTVTDLANRLESMSD